MAVTVYPDGFTVEGFGHHSACRWADVEGLFLGHTMTSPYLNNNPLVVTTRSKAKEAFIDATLHQNEAVLRAIQEHTLPHLLPDYLRALEGGERLSFVDYCPPPMREDPTIHLTKEGIESGDCRLPWTEVRDVRCGRSKLTIVPHAGRGRKISYYNPLTIPNVHVLAAIIRGRVMAAS